MRRQCVVLGLVLASACSAFSGGDDEGDPATPGPDGDAAAEGSPSEVDGATPGPTDASAPPRCDPEAKFGAPEKLELPNEFFYANAPRLLPDERTLVFAGRTAANTDTRLYVAMRKTADGAFSIPSLVPFVDYPTASFGDGEGWLSPDGLTLFFASTRHLLDAGEAGATFDFDLFRATRGSASEPFAPPTRLDALSLPVHLDTAPSLDSQGAVGVFGSNRSKYSGGVEGRRQLFSFTVAPDGGVGAPEVLPAVQEQDEQLWPALSPDGRRLFFALRLPNDPLPRMVYADRPSLDAGFATVEYVFPQSGDASVEDRPGWISPDGCRLYFARGSGLEFALYMTERGK